MDKLENHDLLMDWLHTIETSIYFVYKKKYFAYLEFFLLIQGKKNLIAVDRALGACEAPWKFTVFLELLSRKPVHFPDQLIPGATPIGKGRGSSK